MHAPNMLFSRTGNDRTRPCMFTMVRSRRVAPLLVVALSTMVAGCGRPMLHCGQTVTMDGHDTFLAALVERGQHMFTGRLQNVEVIFHADGEEIGRARTDRHGYALAIGRIPHGAVTYEARASFEGHDLTDQGRVLKWEPDRTIIVCDIDGTISDTDVHTLLDRRMDTGSKPLPGSVETLQRLSGSFNLVFLTGRPVFLYRKTHEWLKDNGFPTAPTILAPDLHDASDVEPFKQETIALVKRLYPNALIGIGNAETDSQAYTAEGMLAIMVDDGKNRRFRPQALPLRTWSRVGQFFEANGGTLSDPAKLRELVAEGGMLLYPQPPVNSDSDP